MDGHEPIEGTPMAPDLMSYLVVSVPDLRSLERLVPALAELVEAAAVRLLDLVVLERGADGVVDVHELEGVESLAGLRGVEGDVGGLLTEHDIQLASSTLRLGTCGVLVVTEDRWALPLSVAAHEAGGRIAAGERIPPSRVEDVLAERNGRAGGPPGGAVP
ncbi:DUF6325 family protein [Jiangella rhizosphaerae]|uniref:DUF1269 domain-containing protein n=1 Tax=Jiangella rhizosphaerae TaxID=2293569 RepID=A0A418KKQ4_9ACTN|nr:DUF6325 family protein [Jiangella rhizosphaerae]RIQ18208.1 hypothetical protein DY240_21515 [Jiangella rhizosphaerae]